MNASSISFAFLSLSLSLSLSFPFLSFACPAPANADSPPPPPPPSPSLAALAIVFSNALAPGWSVVDSPTTLVDLDEQNVVFSGKKQRQGLGLCEA